MRDAYRLVRSRPTHRGSACMRRCPSIPTAEWVSVRESTKAGALVLSRTVIGAIPS